MCLVNSGAKANKIPQTILGSVIWSILNPNFINEGGCVNDNFLFLFLSPRLSLRINENYLDFPV